MSAQSSSGATSVTGRTGAEALIAIDVGTSGACACAFAACGDALQQVRRSRSG